MRREHGIVFGFFTATLLAVAGCASSGTNIDREIELSVSPQVVGLLAAHKPAAAPAAQLVSVKSTTDIDHKANFGRIDTGEDEWAFHWQEDGRLATTVVATFRTPTAAVQGVATSTSLCGLVPVLVESASTTRAESVTAVRVGGTFVPFGFSSKGEAATRSRLVSFTTSAPDLCNPTAGTSFSYQFAREEQRTRRGSVSSSNKLHTITESTTCEVGKDALPAADIGQGFTGNYLR